MTIIFYLLLWPFLGNTQGLSESIKYRSPQRQFEIEKTSSFISLRQQGGSYALRLNGCNRSLVERFWADAKDSTKALPRVKNEKLRPQVVVNGERRWLAPMQKNNGEIKRLDQKFVVLLAQEKRQCGKA